MKKASAAWVYIAQASITAVTVLRMGFADAWTTLKRERNAPV
jgi:hypothetical protein